MADHRFQWDIGVALAVVPSLLAGLSAEGAVFTTFSALAVEATGMLDSGRWALAAGYVGVTVVAGLVAVRIGARVAGAPRAGER